MKITHHHDGHGLNDSITIIADARGGPEQGGASHYYEVFGAGPGSLDGRARCGEVQFQKGPRHADGSIAGLTNEVLLAIVKDRLLAFQDSKYACAENEMALAGVNMALAAGKFRADKRAARGVLGTAKE